MVKDNLSFLPSNPFFSKIISLGDNFGAEGELLLFKRKTLRLDPGIEDGQADTSGYVCQHLGNLECQVQTG